MSTSERSLSNYSSTNLGPSLCRMLSYSIISRAS